MNIGKKAFSAAWWLFLKFRWNMSGRGARLLRNAFAADYKRKALPRLEIWKIHRKGFVALDYCLMGITEENCKQYLSNVEYYRMHPINGRFSAWIDDKLTLKYLCSGTELDRYMPGYYYQIDADGNVLCLVDCTDKKEIASVEDIADLLQQQGLLAIKQIAGSIGEGFYKAAYEDGAFYLNGARMERQKFCEKIASLRDYIVIEYLKPHGDIAAVFPDTPNTIRYQLAKINGRMEMVKGFIRFGTKRSGCVENYNVGGIMCYLNEKGHYICGNSMLEGGKGNVIVTHHPDTMKELEGDIPLWDEIVEAGRKFAQHFPQMRYLGFDFVVTDQNCVKMLEINSLTSLDCLQVDGPVQDTKAGEFFRQRRKH